MILVRDIAQDTGSEDLAPFDGAAILCSVAADISEVAAALEAEMTGRIRGTQIF